MFMVTEADAAAIRTAFHEEGELSAIIELRQRFPGITDHAQARACARTIAGWRPPPAAPCPTMPRHPSTGRRRSSPTPQVLRPEFIQIASRNPPTRPTGMRRSK